MKTTKFKPFQIRWNEKLGLKECPYLTRYVLILFGFSIRLHVWKKSDDKRFFHDHPWSALIFCLKGGYTDVSPNYEQEFKAGQWRFMPAEHQHFVAVPETGAITLLFCGPTYRKWGYWINGKLRRPLEYFSKWGHPPCEN